VAQQYEGSAEKSLHEFEKDRGYSGSPYQMTPGEQLEAEDHQSQSEPDSQAAGEPVHELDDGGDLRGLGDGDPVTKRPVLATTGAGAGGANNRAPQDDGDIAGENDPGVLAKEADAAAAGLHSIQFLPPAYGSRDILPQAVYRRIEFMHRLVVMFISAASIVALTGCGSPAHGPEEKYFLVATNTKVPYWQNALAGLAKASSQMKGIHTEMVGPETYDPNAEHEEFQHALTKKPTGILVSVSDPKVIQPDIDAAIAQGIPVITMDSDAEKSKRLLFIGTDNYRAGMMGGKVLAENLKDKGNVVVFTIPEQANLAQRMHGYSDVLANHSGLKVTQTVDMKGDPRVAFDTTMDIISKKAIDKIDAFVCLEAIACPEIADVLDREHVKGKVVVAMDTDDRTLTWIQKGMINATIGQKPFTMAFYGIQMLDNLYHNKPATLDRDWAQDSFSTLPEFVDTGVTLIDKSNVDAYMKQRDSATAKQ
jgi:ribose transport system substrate-binding protein